jgi:outer membrane protein
MFERLLHALAVSSCLGVVAVLGLTPVTGRTTPLAPEPLRLSLSLSLSLPAEPVSGAPEQAATDWRGLLEAAHRTAANRREQAAADGAEASHEQARIAAWRPRVDARASSTLSRQRYNDQPLRTPASALGLTLTQPLWRAAERAHADSLQAQAQQAARLARAQQQQTALALSLAWLDAVEAAEALRLNDKHITALEAHWHAGERRVQAGVGTLVEQLETRSLLEQARAMRQSLQLQLSSARLSVERLAGQPVQVPAGLRPAMPLNVVAVPPANEGLAQLLARNATHQAHEHALEAARSALVSRQAERWQPTVDVVAEVSRARQSQQFDGVNERQDIHTRAMGVQVNWPLFTSGYQQARTREALAQLEQAEAHRDQTRDELTHDLLDAYETLHTSQRMVASHRELEATARRTLDAVHKAYLAGLRTHQELLGAQQRIHDSLAQQASSRIQALKAQVRILSLLDRLTPEDITPLTTALAPERHTEPSP